jgi:hypothetical protein
VEPRDTAILVDFANRIAAKVQRSVDYWVHMPVPIDRDDAAYFAPLERLRVKGGTAMYLGLLHASDGVEGATRRIAAARRALGHFGVATECGMRYVPRDELEALLDLHRQIALA